MHVRIKNQVDPAEIKYLSSKTAGVHLLKDIITGKKFHHQQRTKIQRTKQGRCREGCETGRKQKVSHSPQTSISKQ